MKPVTIGALTVMLVAALFACTEGNGYGSGGFDSYGSGSGYGDGGLGGYTYGYLPYAGSGGGGIGDSWLLGLLGLLFILTILFSNIRNDNVTERFISI